MKLDAPLPWYVTWGLRIVMYAVSLAVIWAIVVFIENMRMGQFAQSCLPATSQLHDQSGSPLDISKRLASCIRGESNFFDNFWNRKTYKILNGLPDTPQSYVGVWQSEKGNCKTKFYLYKTGLYLGETLNCSGPVAPRFSGVWGVHEKNMVWLPVDELKWPVDINPVLSSPGDSFVLREQNGQISRFTRLNEEISECPKSCESFHSPNWACPDSCITPKLTPLVTTDESQNLSQEETNQSQ